jgi:hypothetical protein
VKADEERKLQAGQKNRIEPHELSPSLARGRTPSTTTLAVTIFVGQAMCVKPVATAIFCAPFAV